MEEDELLDAPCKEIMLLDRVIHRADLKYGIQSIFAHSRAIALRGKFCSDKSPQNLNPRKYSVCHTYATIYE
jgi:hypothetical protein